MPKIKNVSTVTSIAEFNEPSQQLLVESHPIRENHVILVLGDKRLIVNSDELILAIENSTNIRPNNW